MEDILGLAFDIDSLKVHGEEKRKKIMNNYLAEKNSVYYKD
jgi:hypothetical protein